MKISWMLETGGFILAVWRLRVHHELSQRGFFF